MKQCIGSSSDDSIGVGTPILGTDIRKVDDGYEIYRSGEWFKCYDASEISVVEEDWGNGD
jgi:hypothetical protein